MNNIELTKFVPHERWGKFFDQFSTGNCGRHVAIDSISPELGDQELVQNAHLMAVIYDPHEKQDNLVIRVGREEETYTYEVDSPTKVSTEQDSSGWMRKVEIIDATGLKIQIKLLRI
jgi:hypothetical protein